jgi:homopolymeric O-antigen transport system ATP-binding protein
VAPIISFERVGKRYKLNNDRPRSLRDIFVRPRSAGRIAPANSAVLWALRDVSFEIERGETVGLIGANGAGKSTALKLISRVIVPNEGRVGVTGRVAALLELGSGFHPELSGRDNIYLSGALVGMGRAEMSRKYDSIVEFANLEKFIDMPVKHYSSGMFARLAFAVSIHLEPEVLLVDEVLAVGDYAFQRRCLDRIAEFQRAGVTVCFVSHAADAVRDLCTRAIWFADGCVVADGPAENVLRRYQDEALTREEQRLAKGAELDASQRWGSRRIEFTSVRLLDAQDHERHIYETGEPMVVQMSYLARERVASAVFGVAIHRLDGFHVTGPNTAFAGLHLPDIVGAGTIRYRIPYMPLLEGQYGVTAAAHNEADTEMFDYHDRAYPFRVVNPPGGFGERYGLMTLRGEWQLPGAPEPLAPLAHAAPQA